MTLVVDSVAVISAAAAEISAAEGQVTASKIWIAAILINLCTITFNMTMGVKSHIKFVKQMERINFKGTVTECQMDSIIRGADTETQFTEEKLKTLQCIQDIVSSGSFVYQGYEPRMFREKK
jgi:hypothetical protein